MTMVMELHERTPDDDHEILGNHQGRLLQKTWQIAAWQRQYDSLL